MRLILLLTLALLAAAPAIAQPSGCRYVEISTNQMTGDSLPLYGLDMRYAAKLSRADVPSRWRMMDCGDPIFLGAPLADGMKLVRRSALIPPDAPATICMCPSPGRPGAEVLGVPGAGPLPLCPESVRRCPRQ